MIKVGNRKQPRLTLASIKVLRVFLETSAQQLAGIDIKKPSGVATGSLYPILMRFESFGWLASKWEDVDPKEVGRPRRHLYWLTKEGAVRANEALGDLGGRVATANYGIG
jgi:DNA-binding PadR family transcriptional regulator